MISATYRGLAFLQPRWILGTGFALVLVMFPTPTTVDVFISYDHTSCINDADMAYQISIADPFNAWRDYEASLRYMANNGQDTSEE